MLFAAKTSSLDAHGLHVRRLVRGAAVALLLLATAARADDGNASAISEMSAEEASTAPASTRNSWYGWQILLTDLASVGVFMGGAVNFRNQTASEMMVATSGFAYQFGGPAVHLAHHRPGGAGWSLLRRLVLPVGGGLLGAVIAGRNDHSSGDEFPPAAAGALLGGLTGIAVAMGYDWVTAREEVATPPPATLEDASSGAGSRWAPVVAVGRDRASVGLALNF